MTKQIEGIDGQIKAAQQDHIEHLKKTTTAAAEFVYAAAISNAANSQPNLYTAAVHDELQRATCLVGLPSATAAEESKHRLDLRLAQTEQALAELRIKYAEKDLENKALKETAETKQKLVGKLETERDTKEHERADLKDQLISTDQKLVIKQQQLIGHEQENVRRAEDLTGLKKQLMLYFGLAAIATGLLAAFSSQLYPPVTVPLSIAATAFGAASAVVMFISIWIIVGFGAVAVIGIGLACWIRYAHTREIADGSTGAIAQLKNAAADGDETARAAYTRLRTDLIDWYGESGHALDGEIQGRLKSLNVIGNTAKSWDGVAK